jgi:hypothetical protein
MSILTASSTPVVNPTPGTADGWPAWTDEDRWVPTDEPSADDRRWAAEQNTDWHDQDAEDDADFDRRAEDAAAVDALELGLCFA